MRTLKQKKTPAQQEYDALVKQVSPKSEVPWSLVKAFVVGGLICCLGQAFNDLGEKVFMLDKKGVSAFTSMALIFLSALFTGLGVYDKLGQFAGAGSIVPITGFANSIVSPAMEFKREGFVLGVGAKMFVVAGPVLVYGITASVLYGLIYFIVQMIMGG